jgi:hypothetical protein
MTKELARTAAYDRQQAEWSAQAIEPGEVEPF